MDLHPLTALCTALRDGKPIAEAAKAGEAAWASARAFRNNGATIAFDGETTPSDARTLLMRAGAPYPEAIKIVDKLQRPWPEPVPRRQPESDVHTVHTLTDHLMRVERLAFPAAQREAAKRMASASGVILKDRA